MTRSEPENRVANPIRFPTLVFRGGLARYTRSECDHGFNTFLTNWHLALRDARN